MPWDRGVLRIGAPVRAQRPKRGLPFDPGTVERVRALYEGSRLTLDAIAAEAGVCVATVRNWARNAGWARPPHAPGCRWHARVGQSDWHRRRTAPARALAAAERILAELEGDDAVDLHGLAGVLTLLGASRERNAP